MGTAPADTGEAGMSLHDVFQSEAICLPSKLDTSGHMIRLQVKKDKLQCKYQAIPEQGTHDHDVGVIHADVPFPTDILVYYFEMRVLNHGSRAEMSIGFAAEDHKPGRAPGWERDSYGYFANGTVCTEEAGNATSYGQTFRKGDVVGAGVHLNKGEIFFTKNGEHLGVAFRGVHGQLYPTVGLHSEGEEVRVNFGEEPFQFDLAAFRAQDYASRMRDVEGLPLSQGVVHALVLDYLAHYGFRETLRAFASAAGYGPLVGASTDGAAPARASEGVLGRLVLESLDERAEIRERIVAGDVMGAMESLDARYPGLLAEVPVHAWPEEVPTTPMAHVLGSEGSGASSGEFHSMHSDPSSKMSVPLLSGWVDGVGPRGDGAAGRLAAGGAVPGPSASEATDGATTAPLRTYLHAQHVVELARRGAFMEAAMHAREHLAGLVGTQECWSAAPMRRLFDGCLDLLAYEDLEHCAGKHLLEPAQREWVADLTNRLLLQHLYEGKARRSGGGDADGPAGPSGAAASAHPRTRAGGKRRTGGNAEGRRRRGEGHGREEESGEQQPARLARPRPRTDARRGPGVVAMDVDSDSPLPSPPRMPMLRAFDAGCPGSRGLRRVEKGGDGVSALADVDRTRHGPAIEVAMRHLLVAQDALHHFHGYRGEPFKLEAHLPPAE